MAFQSFFASMEQSFSDFLEEVVLKKDAWKTKDDLMALFLNVTKQPQPERITKTKPVVHECTDEKCVFVITRGEKQGSKCGSRVKPGTSYCVKHFKSSKDDDKEDKKEVAVPEKKVVTEESKTISLEMKFKKEEVAGPSKTIETVMQDGHRVIKNTKVVVNQKNEILGYLIKTGLKRGATKETDKIAKEYKLVYNKDDLPEDHIDEE